MREQDTGSQLVTKACYSLQALFPDALYFLVYNYFPQPSFPWVSSSFQHPSTTSYWGMLQGDPRKGK